MDYNVKWSNIPKLFKYTVRGKPRRRTCAIGMCIYRDEIYFVRDRKGKIKFGLEIDGYYPDAGDICSNCEKPKKMFKIAEKYLGEQSPYPILTPTLPFEIEARRSLLFPIMREEHHEACPNCKGHGTTGKVIRQVKVYYPVIVDTSPRGLFEFWEHKFWEKPMYEMCIACLGKGYVWVSNN